MFICSAICHTGRVGRLRCRLPLITVMDVQRSFSLCRTEIFCSESRYFVLFSGLNSTFAILSTRRVITYYRVMGTNSRPRIWSRVRPQVRPQEVQSWSQTRFRLSRPAWMKKTRAGLFVSVVQDKLRQLDHDFYLLQNFSGGSVAVLKSISCRGQNGLQTCQVPTEYRRTRSTSSPQLPQPSQPKLKPILTVLQKVYGRVILSRPCGVSICTTSIRRMRRNVHKKKISSKINFYHSFMTPRRFFQKLECFLWCVFGCAVCVFTSLLKAKDDLRQQRAVEHGTATWTPNYESSEPRYV